LNNSNFHIGLNHWYFSPEIHLRWRVKNVFLHIYFEGGAIGWALFVILLLIMEYRLLIGMIRSDPLALAIIGVLLVGSFDSLFDFRVYANDLAVLDAIPGARG